MFFYFFFFQAEDGIRDTSVTGVQTCALPISRRGPFVDVGQLVSALTGHDSRDPIAACGRCGIVTPDFGPHRLDRLRAEAHAIAALYQAAVDRLDRLDLGVDASQLVSTGGLASAMLREARLLPLV